MSLAETQHCHLRWSPSFMCGPPGRPGLGTGPQRPSDWNASRPGVSERPLGGGRAKIENSSRRHPRKFGQKRFLAVTRSWRGNGVAYFGYLLEKIIGGVTAIVAYRPGGWMHQSTVPRCAILPVGSTGRMAR